VSKREKPTANTEPPTAKKVSTIEWYYGYVTGLRDAGWVCADCGNTYEATVDECPNRMLDQGEADIRAAKWRTANGA
jgi:hypothetical protein